MKKNVKYLFLFIPLAFVSLPLFAVPTHQNMLTAPLVSDVTATGIVRGVLGIVTIFVIAWLFSTNRKAINWKTVGIGLFLQILLALGVLFVPFVNVLFTLIGRLFVSILDFTAEGARFLFGNLVDISKTGYVFAFQILPTIIFFSALTSLLFYLGIIQKVVSFLAKVMVKLMGLSGAESLSVAGNIFLGMTEAPLLIKAYLDRMNRSEIFLVMTGGMATIAGGVLAAYVGFLGGDDVQVRLLMAKHLLAASVMAAPGAVVLSKMLVPQTESVNQQVNVTKSDVGKNLLDAIANGTTEGLKLAANIAVMLLVFIAFVAMANAILSHVIGGYMGLNEWVVEITSGRYQSFNLQFIIGTLISPFMWLLGVPQGDIAYVGELLGEKIILNEFIGYASLADMRSSGVLENEKSLFMAVYILCGFANIGSIGIQIGGIGSLAPSRKVWLSQMGVRALLAGTLASCLSATIVGMLMG